MSKKIKYVHKMKGGRYKIFYEDCVITPAIKAKRCLICTKCSSNIYEGEGFTQIKRREPSVTRFCHRCSFFNTEGWEQPFDWVDLEKAALERDNYRCTRCSIEEDVHVVHKISFFYKWTDDLDNLITLCPVCTIMRQEYLDKYNEKFKHLKESWK